MLFPKRKHAGIPQHAFDSDKRRVAISVFDLPREHARRILIRLVLPSHVIEIVTNPELFVRMERTREVIAILPEDTETLLLAIADHSIFLGTVIVRRPRRGKDLVAMSEEVLVHEVVNHIHALVDAGVDQHRHDQHVRVPLDHQARIHCDPERAMRRLVAMVELVHQLVSFGIVLAGTTTFVVRHDLHRGVLREPPRKRCAIDESSERGRMKRHHMTNVLIHFHELLDREIVMDDVATIRNEAVVIHVEQFRSEHTRTAQCIDLSTDVVIAVEQHAIDNTELLGREINTHIVRELRRTHMLAARVVRPEVHRTRNDPAAQVAGNPQTIVRQHPRLAVSADVRNESVLAIGTMHEDICPLVLLHHVVITRIRNHRGVAHVVCAATVHRLTEAVVLRIEVVAHRQRIDFAEISGFVHGSLLRKG